MDSARALAAALFALAIGLALRAPLADVPLERDEGEYAYIAWRWLDGEVPYRDTVNRKPPAVFLAYAPAIAATSGSPRALHFGLGLWLAASQMVLFAFARRLAGTSVALGAALLFALFVASPALLGNAAQIEALATLPIALAACFAESGARTGRAAPAAAAGLAAGTTLLFKTSAAPIAAFALAWLVLGAPRAARERARLAAVFAAGAAAALAPVLAYFAAAGALAALVDSVVTINLAYATSIPLRDYPAAFRAGIAPTLSTLGPVYAAAALGPLARRAARVPAALPSPARGWVAGWLGAALLAAAAGGYFRQHYFLYAAPPLALLAAAGLRDLAASARLPGRLREAAPAAGALAAIALSVALFPAYHLPGDPDAKSRALYGANPFPESRDVAAFLALHSAPADRMFVFGSEPQLHYLARLRNAGRYMLGYHYLEGTGAWTEARQREVLAALEAEPPRWIVTALYPTSLLDADGAPRTVHRGLTALLRARYAPAAVLRLTPEGRARLDTRPSALAPWAADPRLERERSGWLVIYERRER